MDYFRWIALLLELIGMHPRQDRDEAWTEMLRRAGWRRFVIERYCR